MKLISGAMIGDSNYIETSLNGYPRSITKSNKHVSVSLRKKIK